MSEAKKKEVVVYQTVEGAFPIFEWLDSLKDKRSKEEVRRRLDRLQDGNYGDHHSLPGAVGLGELRITYGPGYRIYYGETEVSFVVLLCGGDKSTQSKDIKKAKAYWKDYLEYSQEKEVTDDSESAETDETDTD